MKILIINPPAEKPVLEYPNEKGERFIEPDDFGFFPPLGALYVLSYLEKLKTGDDLFFKDCVAEKYSHKMLFDYIKDIKPDVIGITSFTALLVDILFVIRTVRCEFPAIHICLGGPHATAFPFEAVGLEGVDSIVVGEGEKAFSILIEYIRYGKEPIDIPGVYTKKSIAIWKNKSFDDSRYLGKMAVPPAFIEEIDELPQPNRDYIKHINYHSIVGVSNKLATIITSRGCPYQCIFCDVPIKKYRKRDAKLVIDEVEACLNQGYQEVHFYDDLFNISPMRLINICEEIDKRKLKFPWDFRGRVNSVTRESLCRAKKSGCRMISFGVETGTNEGLMFLNKNTTIDQIRNAFRLCSEFGIKTIADFMIGLPFERSKEDIFKNIDFLIELNPDYAQIGILSLYPNTRIYDMAAEKGLINPARWSEFSCKPTENFTVDHWVEFLSTSQLIKIHKQAYRKFYLRPNYAFKQLVGINSIYEFKSKLRGFLKLFN
ncbi:MAG: B12-binding domain-containing radical SAM protein [Oligoflexales bacterium]|nr:B12-binding domain-containing radical SAM protein [Oligoflexales bacterium]